MKFNQSLEMQGETESSDYKFFNAWGIKTNTVYSDFNFIYSQADAQSNKISEREEITSQTPNMSSPSFARIAKRSILQSAPRWVTNIVIDSVIVPTLRDPDLKIDRHEKMDTLVRAMSPNTAEQTGFAARVGIMDATSGHVAVFANTAEQTGFAARVGIMDAVLGSGVVVPNKMEQMGFASEWDGLVTKKSKYNIILMTSEFDEDISPHRRLTKKVPQLLSNERDIERSLSDLTKKFRITNLDEFQRYMIRTSVMFFPEFNVQFEAMSENINKFFINKSVEYSGQFEIFKDPEIADMQNLSIIIYLKNMTPKQCVDLSNNLVEEINKSNAKLLDFIQIQIIPT